MNDLISRQQAIMAIEQHRIAVLEGHKWDEGIEYGYAAAHRHLVDIIEQLPFAQPERKIGHWILDRSGAYCCSKCMEPCASYVMMKPRDKFCKMCGSRNEVRS